MNQLRDLIVKSFVMERVGHQVARVISHLRRTVIMVNGEIVQVRARDAKNGAVPVQVVVTDSNQADGGIDSAHRCSVAVEIPRVGLCVAVSAHPGSPNLVAEFPVFHPEWFGWPLAARMAPYLELAGPLAYSTHAAASSAAAPRPSTFTVSEGSAPRLRQ